MIYTHTTLSSLQPVIIQFDLCMFYIYQLQFKCKLWTARNLVTMYYIAGNVRGSMSAVDVSLWQRSLLHVKANQACCSLRLALSATSLRIVLWRNPDGTHTVQLQKSTVLMLGTSALVRAKRYTYQWRWVPSHFALWYWSFVWCNLKRDSTQPLHRGRYEHNLYAFQ